MKRPGSPNHLAWIRTLPCLICRIEGVEAHHLLQVPGERRGMGRKHADKWTVPLCGQCHRAAHLQVAGTDLPEGRETAWFRQHGIDAPKIASFLWRNSGDSQAAYDLIREAA